MAVNDAVYRVLRDHGFSHQAAEALADPSNTDFAGTALVPSPSLVSYFNPDPATLDLSTDLGSWQNISVWNALSDTRVTPQPTWIDGDGNITPPAGVYLIHFYAAFQFTSSTADVAGDFVASGSVSVNSGAADPAYNFVPSASAHIDTSENAFAQKIVVGTSFVQPIEDGDTVGLDYRIDAFSAFTPVSGQIVSVGGTGVQVGFTKIG